MSNTEFLEINQHCSFGHGWHQDDACRKCPICFCSADKLFLDLLSRTHPEKVRSVTWVRRQHAFEGGKLQVHFEEFPIRVVLQVANQEWVLSLQPMFRESYRGGFSDAVVIAVFGRLSDSSGQFFRFIHVLDEYVGTDHEKHIQNLVGGVWEAILEVVASFQQ